MGPWVESARIGPVTVCSVLVDTRVKVEQAFMKDARGDFQYTVLGILLHPFTIPIRPEDIDWSNWNGKLLRM
eukprot:2998965-Pyramimonas_sp.AAC.2